MESTPNHYLVLKDPAGTEIKTVVDFIELACTIQVNAPGSLLVRLKESDAALLEHLSQVEYHRRDPANGVDWYTHFTGLHIQPEWDGYPESNGLATFLGDMEKLRWRHVMWLADTLDRSKFYSDPVETIMKTLVNYNAGPAALTSNGRLLDGNFSGLTVATDLGGGNTKDWFCAWDNLLETLQALAKDGGGDFDLVKTGPAAWGFRFYAGQLGTDRTADLLFSVKNGNLSNVKYVHKRLDEVTVVVVGGSEQGADRITAVVYGPDYSATNHKESFVNGAGVPSDSTTGLQDLGNKKLDESRAREVFTYDVIQTPGSAFGKDYFLGDLGLLENPYNQTTVTQKVNKVTNSLEAGRPDERIDVELITP